MREPRLSAMTTHQMLDYIATLDMNDPQWLSRRSDREDLAKRLLNEYRAHRSRNTGSWFPTAWESRYHVLPALPATATYSALPQTVAYNTHIVRLPDGLKDDEAEELILRQLEEHACPR